MSSRSAVQLAKLKDSIISGNQKKIEAQHAKGKLTARNRIEILLDQDSFEEYGLFIKHRSNLFDLDKQDLPSDGVITGYGTIFGRPVCVFSQDFTVSGGSLGEMHAKKIVALQKRALEAKIPIIGINDSGGARIQEGIDALAGYGDVFQQHILASGVIPQISIIMGPAAGGAVYGPALTDFTIMVKNSSYMFVTGPNVVKAVNNEDVSFEDLGGAEIHAKKSGVADMIYDNDIDALLQARKLISLLPSSYDENQQSYFTDDSPERKSILLDTIAPEETTIPYNMLDVIYQVVDNGDFFEIRKNFAKNIITGFAKIAGKTIGIVANQPLEMAGCIDISASRKAARFVRFCDSFNIPIVTFVDVPGFLPGTNQEHNGIIHHGAKLLFAYGEATVPKVTIITRKSYGGAYIVMGSKHLGGDVVYAWPQAEIAVLGSKAAGEILFRKNTTNDEEYQAKLRSYEEQFCNPYFAASRGFVDSIIKPHMTREMIHRSLELLKNKTSSHSIKKKHSSMPL